MAAKGKKSAALALTNYLTVDANGQIVSVSAESQQPFLN